jgi:hypothetical protein
VGLKVIDLIAQTAWITLREKLGYGDELSGLRRFSYWDMEADTNGGEEIVDDVERVITMDSTFTNQNKHLYRLMMLDESGNIEVSRGNLSFEHGFSNNRGADNGRAGAALAGGHEKSLPEDSASGCYIIHSLVRERDQLREEGYTDRLNMKLNHGKVRVIKAGEVWSIKVVAGTEKKAVGLVKDILVTHSRRKGLLINPHYQDYQIINIYESKEG